MMSEIDITIEEDGTITITTGDIADAQHYSAEEFIEGIEQMMGGKVTEQKREYPVKASVLNYWSNRRKIREGL